MSWKAQIHNNVKYHFAITLAHEPRQLDSIHIDWESILIRVIRLADTIMRLIWFSVGLQAVSHRWMGPGCTRPHFRASTAFRPDELFIPISQSYFSLHGPLLIITADWPHWYYLIPYWRSLGWLLPDWLFTRYDIGHFIAAIAGFGNHRFWRQLITCRIAVTSETPSKYAWWRV